MYRIFSSSVVFATVFLRLTHADPADLVGSWEFTDSDEDGTFVTRLTLEPDGGMQFTTLAELSEELLLGAGDDDVAGGDEAAFAGLSLGDLEIRASGSGRWTATEDLLTISVTEVESTVDGMTPEEYLTGLARDLALSLAARLGIAGDDYPPFEAGVIEALLAEVDAEAVVQIFVEAFEAPVAYSTDDGILTLIDIEGNADVWLRVGQ